MTLPINARSRNPLAADALPLQSSLSKKENLFPGCTEQNMQSSGGHDLGLVHITTLFSAMKWSKTARRADTKIKNESLSASFHTQSF